MIGQRQGGIPTPGGSWPHPITEVIKPRPARPGLAELILEEAEWKPAVADAQASPAPRGPEPARIAEGVAVLEEAERRAQGRGIALAISGGSDSLALLELAANDADLEPALIWTDTGMEYPGTEDFLREVADDYGLELRIARPARTPIEQWRRTGWPFLGKIAARLWTKHHPDAGYRLNVSECCRDLKIRPARLLTRNLGIEVQLTGQRGHVDDAARGLREHLDGAIVYQQRDRLWIASPLTRWTDADVAGFSAARRLREHPAKAHGARTIGCLYCGGGSQFENSGIRVLRRTLPGHWRDLVVDYGAGAVILALKYNARLEEAQAAIGELGGLAQLARTRPWVFDFTRRTPLRGYAKEARA